MCCGEGTALLLAYINDVHLLQVGTGIMTYFWLISLVVCYKEGTAMISCSTGTVLSSRDVVPGDVVLIGNSLEKLELDAVLLQGSVISNEAMLTGESVPVTKVSSLPRST